jgi:hypothetical protein
MLFVQMTEWEKSNFRKSMIIAIVAALLLACLFVAVGLLTHH